MIHSENKKTKIVTLSMIIGLGLVVLLIMNFIFPVLLIGGAFEPPMTPKIAQRDYNKYQEEFNAVVQYIYNNDINDFIYK